MVSATTVRCVSPERRLSRQTPSSSDPEETGRGEEDPAGCAFWTSRTAALWSSAAGAGAKGTAKTLAQTQAAAAMSAEPKSGKKEKGPTEAPALELFGPFGI